MVSPLHFGLLFPECKGLSVYFPLCLGLWVPGRYEFYEGRIYKPLCCWLVMRLRVTSLNNGYLDVRLECAKHKWQLSVISAEDFTAVKLLSMLLDVEALCCLGITGLVFSVSVVLYVGGIYVPLVSRYNAAAFWLLLLSRQFLSLSLLSVHSSNPEPFWRLLKHVARRATAWAVACLL